MFSERELDKLCWNLVSSRNRFYPPDETAMECLPEVVDIEALKEVESQVERYDEIIDNVYKLGNKKGYHAAAFIMYDDVIESLYMFGVNVLARANRYTMINREAGNEFRLEDDPDFYRAVKGGAANRFMSRELYDDIELESLDWDAYTVEEI